MAAVERPPPFFYNELTFSMDFERDRIKENSMRRLISIAAAVAFMAAEAMTGGSAAAGAATPVAGLEMLAHSELALEKAQFAFGGRNFCFYDNGWQRPGWYWCGYAFRRGLGWGGPQGWHGWNRGSGWNNGHRQGGGGWRGGGRTGVGGHGGGHGGGGGHR
jgi:hypothetical protein